MLITVLMPREICSGERFNQIADDEDEEDENKDDQIELVSGIATQS